MGKTITAKVVDTFRDGAEVIEVNGHKIQFGYGNGGDGYCYSHQSFNCLDRLTDDELVAISKAE